MRLRPLVSTGDVQMTPAQLKALCEYTEAVCAHMLHYATDLATEHRRYKAARAKLELAFGVPLPQVDLFAPKPPAMPDLL